MILRVGCGLLTAGPDDDLGEWSDNVTDTLQENKNEPRRTKSFYILILIDIAIRCTDIFR